MSIGIGGNYGLGNVAHQRFNPQKAFERIDADGNGALNIDEFQGISEKISEVSGKELNFEEIFSKLDSDNDGSLSTGEMETLRDEMKSAIKEKLSQVMFTSKEDLQSNLMNYKNDGFKNLLNMLNDQKDSRDETFSLFDVKV
jgi:Ca2+-binding EF-hand superfamily protein